jgi:hypothetical protein
MEAVYIILIVATAVVTLLVVYMLRDRITKAQAEFSLMDRKVSGGIEAVPSVSNAGEEEHAETPPHRPLARSGIVGNILEWFSHIRAWGNTRIVNNLLKWGSTIEVVSTSKPQAEQMNSAQHEADFQE